MGMPAAESQAAVPALELKSVQFAYRAAEGVLRGVSLSVAPGEAVALVGPNGSGKTTLLRVLGGILAVAPGSVLIEGVPIGRLSRAELARRVAVVPQKVEFAFDYSVYEVVAMGRIPHQGRLGAESRQDRDAVDQALSRTGIEALRRRSVHELSGGELQLVLIARALAQQGRILLLDEPTSALDLGHQQQVLEVLRSLHQAGGLTHVLVTHDLNLAAREAGRIVLFHRGELVAQGPPSQVLKPELISHVYGATVAVHPTPGREDVPLVIPCSSVGSDLDCTRGSVIT